MDATRGPSHLRYVLRTLFWMGTSIACLACGHWVVEELVGVNLAAVCWSRFAVVLAPLAHASWVARRPAADATWARTLQIAAIGVGIGLIFDQTMALSSHNPVPKSISALLSAGLALGSILLPRLSLRAIAPGVFGEEAGIEGFRGRRGRLVLGHLFATAVVAGGLFAIVVPNFLIFGLRAKAGEARVAIEAIAEAQEAWYAEHGYYLAATALPLGPPGVQKAGFDPEAHEASGFERLGWPRWPGTLLYCRYAVAVENVEGGAGGYTIEAICDIDGDGEPMAFGFMKPVRGSRAGVPAPFGYCSVRGVLPERGAKGDARVLERFGPCDAATTVSRF